MYYNTKNFPMKYLPDDDIIISTEAQPNIAYVDIDRSGKGKVLKMQVKLVGVQPINFTNNNGEAINGTNIFVAFKDENVEGLRTEKFFLKDGIKLPECKLNDSLEISFNMKGKVEMIYKA